MVLAPDVIMAEELKLLDRVRRAIRVRHYSRRTAEAYVHWIRRYIVFHATENFMEKQTLEQLEAALDAISRDLAPRVEELAQKSAEGLLLLAQLLGRRSGARASRWPQGGLAPCRRLWRPQIGGMLPQV